MERSDELRAQELAEKLSCRTASMSKHATVALAEITEALREENEISGSDLDTIRHHLRRHNQEKEKMDDVALKLEQLLNP